MSEQILRVALPAGESHAPLREQLSKFSHQTGRRVEVAKELPPLELTAHLREVLPAGEPYHLLASHGRYTAGLAPWLWPLDELLAPEELSAFEPAALDLCRTMGRIYQLPLSQDTRLLYYRSDFFDDRREQQWFREASGGRELRVPQAWDELAAVAQYFTRPGTRYGFAFPGRGPGLVETFAEIVTTVGGSFYGVDGRPRFYSRAGEWALSLLRDLLLRWEAVPPETPELGQEEVSENFRLGRAALVCDVSGTGRLLCDPSFSAVAGWHGVAYMPAGPSGRRAVWSDCPTLAIPRSCPDLQAALELLSFLTSVESQVEAAGHGTVPSRTAALVQARENLREGTIAQRRFTLAEETLRDSALTAPPVPEYAELEARLWPLLREAICGRLEVVPALVQAQQACEEALGSG